MPHFHKFCDMQTHLGFTVTYGKVWKFSTTHVADAYIFYILLWKIILHFYYKENSLYFLRKIWTLSSGGLKSFQIHVLCYFMVVIIIYWKKLKHNTLVDVKYVYMYLFLQSLQEFNKYLHEAVKKALTAIALLTYSIMWKCQFM